MESATPEGWAIRAYEPADSDALYRICLLTGDDGQDATPLYRAPALLGHYYAAPYAAHDPTLCFLLTHEGETCGYILGTADTVAFCMWSEAHWFPPLRARYPLPAPAATDADAQLIRLLHQGYPLTEIANAYPAHLHIDLLPIAHGRGWGRRLTQHFLTHLRARAVSSLHLGVSRANARAVAFYEAMGFHPVQELPDTILFGLHLVPERPYEP